MDRPQRAAQRSGGQCPAEDAGGAARTDLFPAGNPRTGAVVADAAQPLFLPLSRSAGRGRQPALVDAADAGDAQAQRSALRLSAGAPAAALALLQPPRWTQREALCQALYQALESRQWLTLLGVLNHDDGSERLGWLCALLLDALKLCHGAAASVTNCDHLPLIQRLATCLGEADLRRLLQAWIACRHQLLATPG